MLSILIIGIFAGGLYGAIHAALQAVEDLYIEQENQITASSLVELIRKNFASIPVETIFTLNVSPLGGQYLSEITLENAPETFVWGVHGGYYGPIALGLKKNASGLLTFGIKRMKRDPGTGNFREIDWLPLAGDFRDFRWEFYSNREHRWVGQWLRNAGSPTLARVKYQRQGDPQPTEISFSFPWSANPVAVASQPATP